ncbi:FtsX-like permease family protein [Aureibacillus halotolerans]|uniref:Putative ABC transport system permease protein n=1 Tax=Aureibacillus halotolerans TaxID=1508390 RepID=A0A4R6U7Y4_9BACI|nr:ABC transporter permease [Aureibacillus halotolerans]TDQ42638.1 putative ABC transport system permease protein [Aureibacillus halotolerans]
MTFRQFAFNNVLRNKRIYAAYFLSSLFTVMVFFTFAIFAFHPSLAAENISHAQTGMTVSGGIIYVFSFFFVLYSMGSFLQSRKKEFGLLVMQGMSLRQVRSMVFLENMLIGFLATVGGIGLGLLFAKGILLTAETVITIKTALPFYFPREAIVVTLLSFLLLFLVISFSITLLLRKSKLQRMIKGDVQSKGEPKASVFLATLAVLLLAGGYVVSVNVQGAVVVLALLPVVLVVTIGTYLFFTQASVFLVRLLKRRKSLFWKKTTMLLFSDLAFRMKDNARTFFLVSIISTVAFSAIGTLYGLQSLLLGGIEEDNPYTFNYKVNGDINSPTEDNNLDLIKKTLDRYNIQTESAYAQLNYYELDLNRAILIIPLSVYNEFAQLSGQSPLTLGTNKVTVVTYYDSPSQGMLRFAEDDLVSKVQASVIELTNGQSLMPGDETVIASKVIPETNPYFVVSDEAFQHLPTPVQSNATYVWNTTDAKKQDVIQVGGELKEKVGPLDFAAVDYELYALGQTFGPILFVGLFIGIVFFVSAGSFLYFRLYTDLDSDKEKFKAIAKIGLTNKELNKVITRQTAILFFAPIAVALIHGAVALTAMANGFKANLTVQSGTVLVAFLVIQVIYFLIVRYLYTRQIQAAV